MGLFFSYFKDLVGREVTVELKNDLAIRGTLHSVDQYLNIKLENTRVVDQDKYPHMHGDTWSCICQVGLLMLDDRIMLHLKEFHVNVWHWIAQCKTETAIALIYFIAAE
ncbi:hypothetical protein GOBAR_DD21318 [Gossypium barbadense]|nr:hypothetical protein GOBAR_DD21318 [Gossypium barbadense]